MEYTNETMQQEENVKSTSDTMQLFKKFCWPGFIMPQFWGVGNGLTIGLAAFFPFLFPFIAIYFGFCGYQHAYESHPMDKTIFYDRQVKWRKGAIIYVGVCLCIFFVFGANGIVNYIINKVEINRLIAEYEDNREQMIKDVEILLNEEYLDAFIQERDYVANGELEYSDDIWHLKNSYKYADLSRRILEFDKPYIHGMSQYFNIEEGGMVWVYFSINEDFRLEQVRYYTLTKEEVYRMTEGPGLIIYEDRWKTYMDGEMIARILNANEL